jgi:uncharacterized lipoprotein YajG
MSFGRAAQVSKKLSTMMIVAVLLASAMLSGCITPQASIPNPTIPHRVAEEAEVVIWVRRKDVLTAERVRVLPGWWLSGPGVLGE